MPPHLRDECRRYPHACTQNKPRNPRIPGLATVDKETSAVFFCKRRKNPANVEAELQNDSMRRDNAGAVGETAANEAGITGQAVPEHHLLRLADPTMNISFICLRLNAPSRHSIWSSRRSQTSSSRKILRSVSSEYRRSSVSSSSLYSSMNA